MKLTGVEVPVDTLSKVEPNTVLMVISDEKGKVKVVKVDRDSLARANRWCASLADAGCLLRGDGYGRTPARIE